MYIEKMLFTIENCLSLCQKKQTIKLFIDSAAMRTHSFILSLFMFNIWGIILVGLATLDDLFHQTHIEAACFYLLGLMSCCIFLYLFFTFTTYYYLGYPCLLVYAVWSFNRIKHASRYKFSCGNCGAKIKNKR